MSNVIVNLTLALVREELELFLDTHPSPIYQKLFANPDLIQELIAYILSRIPNVYIVVEERYAQSNAEHLSKSLEQRMRVEALIQKGIHELLGKNSPKSKLLLSHSQSS